MDYNNTATGDIWVDYNNTATGDIWVDYNNTDTRGCLLIIRLILQVICVTTNKTGTKYLWGLPIRLVLKNICVAYIKIGNRQYLNF